MKILKQLSIIALMCYGASVMAMNIPLSEEVISRLRAVTPESVLKLNEVGMYRLFGFFRYAPGHTEDTLMARLHNPMHDEQIDAQVFDEQVYIRNVKDFLIERFVDLMDQNPNAAQAIEKISDFYENNLMARVNRHISTIPEL